jgi:hypothetical protein
MLANMQELLEELQLYKLSASVLIELTAEAEKSFLINKS